jgi:hypothetical protein
MEARLTAPARGVVALAALAAAGRFLSLWKLHPLNWDEIEYYRASSWVWDGLVPYRDFWEHHTPLQWFLFAPIAAIARGPGTSTIIAMRAAQSVVWVLTFVVLNRWMRDAGIGRLARAGAITLALCSSMFMLAAVEFRVDALACALLVLALRFAQRGMMASSGAALVLAGLANIRLGPLLVVALVAFAVQRRDRVFRLAAGVTAVAAAAVIYLLLTRSAAIAWQRVIVDNYLADRWSARTPGAFMHRLAVPLGLTAEGFVPSAIDPATILIAVVGLIGIIDTLARRRAHFVVLAFMQIVSVIFIAMMKFIQNYHFEVVVILMLPFVALEISRWKSRYVAALLIVLVVFSVVVSVGRGKEDDLRYQDLIMREADRLTPTTGTVFDGAGWALQRRPAYRYWFLRAIVQTLEARGRFEPYRPVPPPAALISDYGMRVWLATHPELRRYFMTHYLPYWRDLWLPGMSAVIAPGSRTTWIVPADGAYAVYASADLAAHPWFRGNPGTYTRLRDGKPLTLRRGTSYTIASTDVRPVGVFIAPARISELFLQPGKDVDIDGAPAPRWHIPHLW